MDYEDFIDMLKFFGCMFAALLVVFSVVIVLVNWHYSYICGNFEQVTGKESKYIFLDTCYVNFNDEWMRHNEYESIRKDLYIKEK